MERTTHNINFMFEKEINKLEKYLHQVNKMFPSYKYGEIKEEISATISSLRGLDKQHDYDSVEAFDEFCDIVWHDINKLHNKIKRKIERHENKKNL